MCGKKNPNSADVNGQVSPFDEHTEQEVNKITPAGGHQQDRMIDFRPLWDAPRDSWDRLVSINPLKSDSGANDGHPERSSAVPTVTNPALLNKILSGDTTSEVVTFTESDIDMDASGSDEKIDDSATEGTALESSLAYSDVNDGEVYDSPVIEAGHSDGKSPLAEVAQPKVVEDPDVQRSLDEEAAAIDATTSQNYIISMAAQRERREKEKREVAPIFVGIAAAIVIVAILVGLGFAYPNKSLSRAAAQSTLRNAGVEALHKAPNLDDLNETAMLVQQSAITRHYEKEGIEYTVAATEKSVIGATRVTTEVERPTLTFATPSDKARWIELDKPQLPGMSTPHTRRGGQRVQIADTTIHVSALSSWPTDSKKLARTLARAIPGVQPVRSALVLATVPGLDREFYHALYGVLSQATDSQMVAIPTSLRGRVPESAKTVEFPAKGSSRTVATITFNPYTGQVFAVEDATPQEQLILIEASGYLNCVDTFGEHAPGSISMGCGTGALLIKGLSWQDWGKAHATGRGSATLNDCDPSCREGEKHTVPVEVEASNPQPCGYGVRIYTQVEATFPKGTGDLQQPAIEGDFPCPVQN